MVKMNPTHISDRLDHIWLSMDQLHLGYLEMEESPEKLEHRNRLENCIHDFLCIVSHQQKFCMAETMEVLHRSATNKKDFSAYKAATAWHSIQLYAGNLLSQPWRKEYRQIKTYCGFYKHQIEANLVGADIMFEAMGYKHCGNGILILEGPICPDRVANVSKDCLIAYVECQIMKTIWEKVSKTFEITWKEVLEFRKNHICSPDQAIRALRSQHYETQTNERLSYAHSYGYSSNHCATCHHATPTTTLRHHHHVPVQCASVKQAYCTNGYQNAMQHNVYASCPVPIGQLIEVEAHHPNISRDTVDRPSSTHRKTLSEDWEYVYRNLESQGYTKDLGEREDILNPHQNRIRNQENIAPMQSGTLLRTREKTTRQQKGSSERGSIYDNVSDVATNRRSANRVQSDSKPEQQQHQQQQQPQQQLLQQQQQQQQQQRPKWECKSCTFLNDQSNEICEICSKSKDNVEQLMEIGGPQCSKCTLVNLRDSKQCQACGQSLEGSPTYI